MVPPPRVGGHPPRAPGAPGLPPLSGSTWPLLGAPSPAVPPAARRSATRVAIAAGNSSRSPAAHLSLSVLQLLWVEELKVGRLRIPVFWGENPHPLGRGPHPLNLCAVYPQGQELRRRELVGRVEEVLPALRRLDQAVASAPNLD